MFRRGPIFRLLSWLTFLVAGLIASPAIAAPIAIETCTLRAAPGMTVRSLFAEPGRFDCATPQKRFGSGDYWVRSGLLPAAAADEIVLASTWQDRVSVHILYATMVRSGRRITPPAPPVSGSAWGR